MDTYSQLWNTLFTIPFRVILSWKSSLRKPAVRLIQIASDDLERRAKNSLHNMSVDSFDESDSVAKSDSAEDNRIENDFGGALSNIRHCSWVNVKHVAQRILGRQHITAAEWLYTKMELTGLCDRNMRYVMVDEIQDYTAAQLQVLFNY